MIARSLLYVPGDAPDKLAKAAGRGADALVLDLEDAVPLERKDLARRTVAGWVADNPGVQTWVRVNNGAALEEDVRAVARAGLHGITLPKASVEDLEDLDRFLDGTAVKVCALVETGAGVLDSRAIASAPRVVRLALGEADLCAELGVSPSEGEPELAPIRMQVVLASAAAAVDPPIGPVSTDFRDLDAYRASTQALRRMGFGGRAAVHPAQVEVVNEVFTPGPEEVEAAEQLVALFERAGGGVLTDDRGRMVDEAVVRAARRTLERARPDRIRAPTGEPKT